MRVDLNLGKLDINENMLIVNKVENSKVELKEKKKKYELDKKKSKNNDKKDDGLFEGLLQEEIKKIK